MYVPTRNLNVFRRVGARRDQQGEGAPVLGEEERATIPTHRLLKRQASAAGEFDYGAIGNRASDR